MLYEIKALKAPWPKGAKVGDVVDMPYLPAWAEGKCSIALDSAQATIEFVEPVPGDGVSRPLDAKPGDQKPADAEVTRAEIADLRQKLEDADKEKARLVGEIEKSTNVHAGVLTERDAAVAEIADLRQKLLAAEQVAGGAAAGGKGPQKKG